MRKLAINGGEKVCKTKFPAYKVIGEEEKKAVERVFESSIFSRFLGCWHEDFYGGPEVQALEKEWAESFNVKHAIAVNSATSALYCAVASIGIEPGEEIIVSPYTMCASATAPLIYNAIPIFADIEEDYFCLDPKSIEEKITDKTRAIIVVDIFGQPYDVDKINTLAKKHNLYVIEDCAQAPGVKYKEKYAGTLGDIGIYSLNYHKHIHCGEGGIIVTDNDTLAEKLRLVRNHAEAVLSGKSESYAVADLVNMLGFNYRMTEIGAAIAREQLKKLPQLISERQKNVEYLNKYLSKIPCLEVAKVRKNSEHAYYAHTIKFNQKIAGIHRNEFIKALQAELMPMELRETEGIKLNGGGVKPLYLQHMFQKKIAFGSKGHPWSTFNSNVNYSKGICPVVENMYENILIIHEYMRPGMTKEDLDEVVKAFEKVWENIEELK